MAITFPRLATISPGERVTSTQLANIAERVNAQIRSGLGDPSYRIMFSGFSMFRQIRNSDDSGFLFPPQAEYFYNYQNLDPQETIWPITGPGEGEGINVANVMGAFVFGSDAADLYAEDIRVADESSGGVPLWLGLTIPETTEQIWELGKRQRGAYDPHSGYIASPAFSAAVEHLKIQPHLTSPHGNSYGGYMPAPERGLDCADPEYTNYLIFFTNLEDGSIQSYPGTCPDDGTHIAGVGRGSRAYYVYKNDGTVDVLPLNQWIQGPYTGGAWIMKQPGEHIPRALNAFTADFRGTEDQRATQTSWLAHAFDTQRFLESQYHLAPQYGAGDDTTVGALYPKWRATGFTTYAAGETIFKDNGGINYYYHEGFVLVSAFIKISGLIGSTSIEFVESGDVIQTVEITADTSGNYAEIVMFDAPGTPFPLSLRWGSDARFTSTAGRVEIECTEIMEYKPELHDLALCLRLASCSAEIIGGGMDGSGLHENSANIISDNYFANGCITNVNGDAGPAGSLAEINTNAVFDAARRSTKFLRMIPRQQFIGYEVNSDGKSVCYFLRMAPGGHDPFEGIGPRREQIATGEIEADIRYTVRSGMITYRDVNYVTGDVFTGVYPTTDFQGDGTVYEHDGIRADAPREGWSNEWVMGHQFKGYNTSESSIWKPDAYSDYWFLNERCHFYGTFTNDINRHFTFGSSLAVFAEAPTGWRYAKNTNRWTCGALDIPCQENRAQRYKSCRIYEPDPEIESSTVLIEGGVEVLKLTFTGRFHAHEDAPASIDRDVSTWDVAALNAEDYRTTENGLREYLVWAHQGKNCTKGSPLSLAQHGNAAYGSSVWGLPDDPYGSCFPSFYFVQLFPKPYDDGNNAQNSHDTPLMADWWMQLEFYIKAMCEGCVDGLTSQDIGCTTGINALFDYTLESLCFEAFGGRWFNALPTVETSYIAEAHTRSDAPQGFGQLPNTILSSEIYNQFASALNLMNRFRVMLPLQLQTRELTGTQTQYVALTAGYGGAAPPDCQATGLIQGAYWQGSPPNPSASTPGAWTDDTTINASVSTGIDCHGCNGVSWVLQTDRVDTEWRWNFTDDDAHYAIPDSWADMIQSNARLLGVRYEILTTLGVEAVDFADSATCGAAGFWFDGTNYLRFNAITVETSECVILGNSGALTASSIPTTAIAVGRDAADNGCCSGANSAVSISPELGNDTAFIEVDLE